MSPEQILGKRLGLHRNASINGSSRAVFSETGWTFLRKQLTAERRSLFSHKASSLIFDIILCKPPTDAFIRPLQHFLKKCKLALILSYIISKMVKHTLKSLFSHFSTLFMKGFTEHYLDAALIPIKSQRKMSEWLVRVMLIECHDHLNHFQSFLIHLLPAPSRIPEIPKEKNSTIFSAVDYILHVSLQQQSQFFETLCLALTFWQHNQVQSS